jgi:hypothetical protein
MSAPIANPGIRAATRVAPNATNSIFGPDGTRAAANSILRSNSMPRQSADLAGVAATLKALAKTHPQLAKYAYADIISRLSPMRQGELMRLVGKSLLSPSAVQKKSATGQTVIRGTSMASDALHDTAKVAIRAKGLTKLAPLPAKLALASVDAKLKYDELRAKGFSHGAANAGATAGLASGVFVSKTGAVIGGFIGGAATSPSGPGAIGGAAIGGIVGSAASGAVDWWFEISDTAALAAANAYDHSYRR